MIYRLGQLNTVHLSTQRQHKHPVCVCLCVSVFVNICVYLCVYLCVFAEDGRFPSWLMTADARHWNYYFLFVYSKICCRLLKNPQMFIFLKPLRTKMILSLLFWTLTSGPPLLWADHFLKKKTTTTTKNKWFYFLKCKRRRELLCLRRNVTNQLFFTSSWTTNNTIRTKYTQCFYF